MVAGLLLRGLIAGALAGLVAGVFSAFACEPAIERAIEFEQALEEAKGHLPEAEIVTRSVQAGLGLLAAGIIHGASLGGFFGLSFAIAYGRIEARDPRAAAMLLALAGFVAIVLVPAVKYPPNPPAIGEAETIGTRTTLHFVMVLISLLAAILASMARTFLEASLGTWNASLASIALFLGAVAVAGSLLPPVNEIPAGFPADVLWEFRIAALGTQVVLWSVLGLSFGMIVNRFLHPALRKATV
jgi:predicted cobalt transporter CbtA